MVSSVGFVYFYVMALIGNNSVMSTALPNNNNLTHTRWMDFLPLASRSGAEEISVACCFVEP